MHGAHGAVHGAHGAAHGAHGALELLDPRSKRKYTVCSGKESSRAAKVVAGASFIAPDSSPTLECPALWHRTRAAGRIQSAPYLVR